MARSSHVVNRPPLFDIDRLPVREDLEPRAVGASVTHSVIIPAFVAASIVGLALAVGIWAWGGFRIVGLEG